MTWVATVFALAFPALKNGLLDGLSTDDAMRLVEVRDFLGGQSWFDLSQHRLDPPGASMHWSRVIDVPLAVMIWLLRPLTGQPLAEAITLVTWPALLLGATLRLAASIATGLKASSESTLIECAAIVLTALSVPALIHFRGGAIDHHNAQIALLLAFIAGLLRVETSVPKCCLAAIAAAMSLAIGLEMLPAIAAGCLVVLALQIWRGGVVARNAGYFGAAICGSSLLLAEVLLPPGSLSQRVCDAFGGPILLLSAGGGFTLVCVALVDWIYPKIGVRFAGASLLAAAVLSLFLCSFPGCLASPYANVDPLVKSFWLDHVFETMSFWAIVQHLPQKLLTIYGFPFLAIVLAAAIALRGTPEQRWKLSIAALPLAALFLTSLWEMRASAAATMLAAPVVAAALVQLHRVSRRFLVVALALSPATFAAVAAPFGALLFRPQWTVVEPSPVASCQTFSSVLPLASLPEGRVVAPIDLGPAILAATHHSIFAAPYHRNNSGNLAMLHIMMAAPSAARELLSGHGVDYVVLCSGGSDQIELARLAPDSLAADLAQGRAPDFLHKLDIDPSGQLEVWRFVDSRAEAGSH